jgi:hypothetical protein
MEPVLDILHKQLDYYSNMVKSIHIQIKNETIRIQSQCNHDNTEKIVEYDKVRTLCNDCKLFY